MAHALDRVNGSKKKKKKKKKNYLKNCENITSDPYILNIVKYGLEIKFENVSKNKFQHKLHMSMAGVNIVDSEILKLLQKTVLLYPLYKIVPTVLPLYQTTV